MQKLAELYRTAQLYAHAAHHLAEGPSFFADHEFLGELYPKYEAAYDSLIERIIGLGTMPDIPAITRNAAAEAASGLTGGATPVMLARVLECERAICAEIAALMAAQARPTDGTQNLLQGLADESEARQYLLQRRIG